MSAPVFGVWGWRFANNTETSPSATSSPSWVNEWDTTATLGFVTNAASGTYRLRLVVYNEAGGKSGALAPIVQTNVNGGGWNTAGASIIGQVYGEGAIYMGFTARDNVPESSTLTTFLASGAITATYSPVNGFASGDSAKLPAVGLSPGTYSEYDVAFDIRDGYATAGDTVQIRLVQGDSTLFDVMSTATFVVAAGAPGEVTTTPSAGRLITKGGTPLTTLFQNLHPTTGLLQIRGGTPSTQTINNTAPTAGRVTITGGTPDTIAILQRDTAPLSGRVTITGGTPSQAVINTLTVLSGRLTTTGGTPVTEALTGAEETAPQTGRITITGYAPTQEVINLLAPSTGRLVIKGQTPVTSTGTDVVTAPSTGRVTITGGTPATEVINDLAPSQGLLTASGYAPTQQVINTLKALAGRITITGGTPTTEAVTAAVTTQPQTGRATFKGYAPTTSLIVTTRPTSGRVVFSGYAPTTKVAVPVDTYPQTGALTMAGNIPVTSIGIWPPKSDNGGVWTDKSASSDSWASKSDAGGVWTDKADSSDSWTKKSDSSTPWT